MRHTHQLDFKGGTSLWNNALYSAEGARFKAGTCILLGKQLVPFIVDSGVLIEGRAQFVILDIHNTRIGTLNIYAPNHTAARAQFWTRLRFQHLPLADWIVAGDFNMTESDEDRSPNYLESAMGQREQSTWNSFALSLGISDTFYVDDFRKIGSKRHTWSKQKPIPKWSRLDRFYVNSTIQALGG